MNKFAAILGAKQGETPSDRPVPASTTTQETRKIGRPTGKRSSTEYAQVTAYIRQTTHQQVKIALLQDGDGQEFSELVEDLLGQWLAART